MLRLGIDIDGTITAQDTFVPYLNRSFNLSISLNDMTDYDLTKLLNITQEEFWDWMNQNEAIIYKEALLAQHAKQSLDLLKEEHKLIYITARRTHLTDITYEWFDRQNIHYDHIELVGGHHKVEAVKNHNIDLFFEDHHGNAMMIAKEAGIPVILFNSPYNQLPIDSNIIRVNNWLEAVQWMNNNKHHFIHVNN
ncbi:hypothetical protein ACMXZI_06515 [Bacillus subtilis]|uniref:Nucleotidase n=1 Tax=Bacillus subtilis TaxID=1423 RepID=A0AAP1EC96_BACIU|nr:nucleotidase [Bacillus subtilis]KAF2421980.1 hypothetical protein B6K89_20135 [Bacillus subtilis]KZD88785.1 HAD-superfamily hydrolase-like protein [Bacillus subtilis]KZD91763.1 HAD-superfamily hydrolase-like protein [Bacillus subtilis]MCL6425035.1 hypothetical protein [Bacillus subtilis]ROT30550.1 hypothetical protein EGD80_03500 [Bacillus subtilis]